MTKLAVIDIVGAIVVGLVAVADFWLFWNFPSTIWPWAVLLFLVVYGVAYWYRPSNFYRRAIGFCLSVATTLAVAPHIYVSLTQGADQMSLELGSSNAVPIIAFVGLAIVFIILDYSQQNESDRNIRVCWIACCTTGVLGIALAIGSWWTSDQDQQTLSLDNGSIGEVNTNNNSPINTQGNITYNQGGVKTEHVDKLVLTMEENFQLKSEAVEKDQLIETLKKAVTRAAKEPGDEWREALTIAEKTGDAADLQALLTTRASELKSQADEKNAEFVEVSVEVAAIAVARGDFEEAHHHLSNALEVQPNSVSVLLAMGNSYVFQGTLLPAIGYYQQALDLSQEDTRSQACILHNMATVCILSERYSDGFQFATKMRAIAEETEDRKLIADAKSDLAACLMSQGNLVLAETLLKEAYQFHHKRDDRGMMVNDLNSLGLLYMHQKRFPKAREMFELSASTAKQLGREKSASISRLNLGIIANRVGDHVMALELLKSTKETIEQSGNKLDLALWYFSASESHYLHENADQGLRFEELGTRVAESVKHYEMIVGFHEQLGKMFLIRNDNSMAIERLKKAIEIAQAYDISESRICVLARNHLGLGYRREGLSELASSELKQALSISQKHRYFDLHASALNNIGLIALDEDKLDQAESAFSESLLIMGENDRGMAATLHRNLGFVALRRGNINKTKSSWTLAAELFRSVDNELDAREIEAKLQSLDLVRVPAFSPLK